ncbi:MAG: HAD-IC family P-type ATPase, partial [Bacteroidia bacterium]|nr:HAD-IC family P-type ATPase [Bacteroidia bacterium]
SLVGIQNFESITGMGIKGEWKAETYYVGNRKLMVERGITNPEIDETVENLQKEGKTVVFFSSSKNVIALIAIADKIKSTSKNAIATLKERGIEVYMLTGDNKLTAESVAKQVGITQYKAETLPSDKANFIKQLQKEGKVVAMVGDGINDSHALAQADLSVAMGKGSDIAIDVAKMTLISSDLQSIPKALQLSKKVVQGIRQNLFWAFIYNIIGIPVAAGILFPINGFLLNPMIAGAAMALSSISVVGNSLRLKFAKL